MSKDKELNDAWWAAHPELRKNWNYPNAVNFNPIIPTHWNIGSGSAASLAFTVVHWHHNLESAIRKGDQEWIAGQRYFLRQYAKFATTAWLVEAQGELEKYPEQDPHWRGYGHRDIQMNIRNLQVALDDFEANKKTHQTGYLTMSHEKHSPGPWKVNMLGGGKGRGGNDFSIRMDVPNSDEAQYAIAIVRRKGINGIARANARLISAAPEMLEALNKLAAHFGEACGCPSKGRHRMTCVWFDILPLMLRAGS